MPVLVIGPQRTGTSLCAGVLDKLGFDLCLNPISPNAEYYESDDWTLLCQEICGDWRCPQIHFAGEETKQKILKLVESLRGKQWAAKTPYFQLIAHMIVPLIPDLKIIRTERDFETSVKSLCRREQNMNEGVARWIQGQSFAATMKNDIVLQHLRVPTCRVKYDDMIDQPQRIIEALAGFVCEDSVDIAPAVRFVNPLLRHFEAA